MKCWSLGEDCRAWVKTGSRKKRKKWREKAFGFRLFFILLQINLT
jgi:hypothetical protein